MTIEEEDKGLVDLSRNLEIRMTGNKAAVDWLNATDFAVFRNYLVDDIKEIQSRLDDADTGYLYNVCEHIFNIQDWIKLIVEDAGFPTFGSSWEVVFNEEFGDKHILKNLYNSSFNRWLLEKSGQYQIGVNSYIINDNELFYRNRLGQWFTVEKATAFDLKPGKTRLSNQQIVENLEKQYKETGYDRLIKLWKEKSFKGKISPNFMIFNNTETTPDDYLSFSVENIKSIINNPISIDELADWYGEELLDLEDMVKISEYVINMTRQLRGNKSHLIYLLRDSIPFVEAQKTLDIISGENTSCGQVMIGRKLLSHKPDNWGYYVITLEALYTAHSRFPNSFPDFYNEYSRLLDLCIAANPKFEAVLAQLAEYLKKHLPKTNLSIKVFDIGFQGSIALFVKYLIDSKYIQLEYGKSMATDVVVGVGAQWSKELFGQRYLDDYFPMLNRIQLMTRSNNLYQYIDGSINTGGPRVAMSDEKTQKRAAVELIVLAMIALVTSDKDKGTS